MKINSGGVVMQDKNWGRITDIETLDASALAPGVTKRNVFWAQNGWDDFCGGRVDTGALARLGSPADIAGRPRRGRGRRQTLRPRKRKLGAGAGRSASHVQEHRRRGFYVHLHRSDPRRPAREEIQNASRPPGENRWRLSETAQFAGENPQSM